MARASAQLTCASASLTPRAAFNCTLSLRSGTRRTPRVCRRFDPAAAQPVQERRTVTVCGCDVKRLCASADSGVGLQVECAGWLELTSPDLGASLAANEATILLSSSEYTRPGYTTPTGASNNNGNCTMAPQRVDNSTYRLVLNPEYYEVCLCTFPLPNHWLRMFQAEIPRLLLRRLRERSDFFVRRPRIIGSGGVFVVLGAARECASRIRAVSFSSSFYFGQRSLPWIYTDTNGLIVGCRGCDTAGSTSQR